MIQFYDKTNINNLKDIDIYFTKNYEILLVNTQIVLFGKYVNTKI